jgi:hypothetical protein
MTSRDRRASVPDPLICIKAGGARRHPIHSRPSRPTNIAFSAVSADKHRRSKSSVAGSTEGRDPSNGNPQYGIEGRRRSLVENISCGKIQIALVSPAMRQVGVGVEFVSEVKIVRVREEN